MAPSEEAVPGRIPECQDQRALGDRTAWPTEEPPIPQGGTAHSGATVRQKESTQVPKEDTVECCGYELSEPGACSISFSKKLYPPLPHRVL